MQSKATSNIYIPCKMYEFHHHNYLDVDQVFLLKEIIHLKGQDYEFWREFQTVLPWGEQEEK